MNLEGKVHFIGETTPVTNSFQKREFVVEYAENPQYPEYIKFEAHQDKCDLLDDLAVGQKVNVFFNIKGKPYVNKAGTKVLFNNLVIWKINADASEDLSAVPSYSAPSSDDDDLPF